jgi:hypothetical protein
MNRNNTAAPRLRSHWLHASGGLFWHLRALRYRNSLWRPFRNEVERWLHDWQPSTDKLIIVGTSAGYTLDADFLQRWQEIVVLEPDPLARRLLQWRYPDARWRFENLDVLSDISNLAWLFECFPSHAILFSNVLGQVAPRDETTSAIWQRSVCEMLVGHHWASYHDVISTSRPPVALVAQAPSRETLDELVARFWRGGELELVDHGTFGLGECKSLKNFGNNAYCIWQLRPRQYHLVEWFSREPLDIAQDALADAPSAKDCCISAEDGN